MSEPKLQICIVDDEDTIRTADQCGADRGGQGGGLGHGLGQAVLVRGRPDPAAAGQRGRDVQEITHGSGSWGFGREMASRSRGDAGHVLARTWG